MVNSSIPKNYTGSPSSLAGTPYLTINKEVTADLDSSNAFEGPEKLLEVWFSPSAANLPASTAPLGLKIVPSEVWKEMLDLVNCQVLSTIESEYVDAYLLSESSMFVFPHKLILKTCGTTTLLYGLPKILEIAATIAKFPCKEGNLVGGTPTAAIPYRVFYSRKNYLFPDRQRGPHRSWRDEVRALDKLFHGGSAYMIGKMNGEHWYLYLTDPNTTLTPPATPDDGSEVVETKTTHLDIPASSAAALCHGSMVEDEDETLEVLMTDLEQNNAKQFFVDDATELGKNFINAQHDILKGGSSDLSKLTDSAVDVRHADIASDDVFSTASSDPDEIVNLPLTPARESYDLSSGHFLGTIVSDNCGLSDIYPVSIYPDAKIDAYLFTPCGFSANGVIPSTLTKAAHYFTVHVTPEKECSYASFETNVPAKQSGRQTAEIVQQIVDIFKPGRFSVTLFEAKPSESELGDENIGQQMKTLTIANRTKRMDMIDGYRRIERIVHDLDGYDLVFRYFERWDWEGGAPRLGEY